MVVLDVIALTVLGLLGLGCLVRWARALHEEGALLPLLVAALIVFSLTWISYRAQRGDQEKQRAALQEMDQ